MELFYLVPVAGLCLLGGYLFLLRSRNRGDLHPVMQNLLDQAVDQRSVMSVEFLDQELAGGRFSGPCVKFDAQTVLVDVSLNKEVDEWIGETVLVGFRLDNKGTSSYYQFVSQLRELPRCTGGFGMLLDTPAEIVPSQKRSFIRLTPSREAIFGIGIWPLKVTQLRPDDPASLGVARICYRQDREDQLSLLNVSAAGLCLELKCSQENALVQQPGDRLLCLLILRPQEGKHTLPLWLDCTVVRCDAKEDEPHSIVRLRFTAWAAPRRGKGEVEWFTVGQEGSVGPLGAWVLRQQLSQLARKKDH
ncbi:MAG: hypothetical protein LBI88_05980 [Deltaproteobacteria bacterium]|jgi:hypothetical protein|nr:hypothetical protein [Deltaproteobacteria bacterium]